MRLASELRKQKECALAAAVKAQKLKTSLDKYKDNLGKTTKELKNKDKELTKSKKSLEKAVQDLETSKTQVTNLQPELQKYKDLEAQARAAKDIALKEKQDLVDGRGAESEKIVENGFNTAIISAIAKMKKNQTCHLSS